MTIRTEIVSDLVGLASIRQPWQHLWDRSAASVFQSHDWVSGWARGIQDRKEIKLHIALAWDDETLVGVIACAIHKRTGLRVLTWAAQLFSDYCDALIDPAFGQELVLPLLWKALWEGRRFDLISFQQVRPDARCRSFFEELADSNRSLQRADRSERCMRIDNKWPNGEAFFRSLNKKGRNNHTRGKRILAELGGDVQFRILEGSDTVDAALDEVLRLKQSWLRANDPASPLLGDDQRVLRAILDQAWQSGLAKLFLLECGGKIAAASFNFVYGNRMEAYFTAYEPDFERASPGTILIVEYAIWAFDQGMTHVDFLRGEEAFKFRMANAETLLTSFSGARTLVGQLAMSGHRWLSRRRQRQETPASQPEPELEPAG